MAMRELTMNELDIFLRQIDLAGQDLEDWERLYEVLFEDIEQELTLIGATSVEDWLQDKVP